MRAERLSIFKIVNDCRHCWQCLGLRFDLKTTFFRRSLVLRVYQGKWKEIVQLETAFFSQNQASNSEKSENFEGLTDTLTRKSINARVTKQFYHF